MAARFRIGAIYDLPSSTGVFRSSCTEYARGSFTREVGYSRLVAAQSECQLSRRSVRRISVESASLTARPTDAPACSMFSRRCRCYPRSTSRSRNFGRRSAAARPSDSGTNGTSGRRSTARPDDSVSEDTERARACGKRDFERQRRDVGFVFSFLRR